MPAEASSASHSTEGPSVSTSHTLSANPPVRCTRCNNTQQKDGARKTTRNLVVCIDGTSNQFGQNNTNIVKLFAKIDLESTSPEQHAYYSSGIGTRPKSVHFLDRVEKVFTDKFDMAVAWNMEEIVKDAYGWLARTYQEGDQVYLFGFSRGAYQVRVLAGMIHEVGLIRTHTDKQIGTAYEHYQAIRFGKPKTRQIAREFKNTFSWAVRVHFVGVWDTVSSVGLIRGDVFLSTSSSAAHACRFRHALALDELRVKFMPEYFHEMNTQTEDEGSKYIAAPLHSPKSSTSASKQRTSTASDNSSHRSESDKIKEVWFAGSHSDVGGTNRPGNSHQAGNVSLLWMRREAADSGLVLKPTDIVWVPDDLDFGISDSMTPIWRAVEYMPIKQQVNFSGAGEDGRRLHRLQPRRIIPGQKVHASVLYANAYKPQARLGEGFDIPIIVSGLDDRDTTLDKDFWETGLFDNTAGQELVTYLSNPQAVTPIVLDRLLFMLRFKEGKECVSSVNGWQSQFEKLIFDSQCVPLVRLVAIVAYYEVSCDPKETPENQPQSQPGNHSWRTVFDEAKKCLSSILATHKHQDAPRVVALLKPLTKHADLREHILTDDVLETLVELLDDIVKRPDGIFVQAMDGLNCLLECEKTRPFIIAKLGELYPDSNVSRLFRILEVKDPHFLIAALRMVLTLARIPDARAKGISPKVRSRILELASKYERLVGLLAVEIALALYNPRDREQLNIRNGRVRANLAGALAHPDRHDSERERNSSVDSKQQIFRDLFGLDALTLEPRHTRLIGKLKMAVEMGGARERTAATMTFLKLCETPAIRAHLLQISLLDVFVKQLRRKDSALLAAYALVTCLKYDDMKEAIKNNNDLPERIINMIRLDYFDEAVGPVEGFQIFGRFMEDDDLRKKITSYNITKVLNMKLGMGKPKEMRTSLICLEIFRCSDERDPWTERLVNESVKLLQEPTWKYQKAGVTILYALSQTKYGVEVIKKHVHEIVRMLLPKGYLPILPTAPSPTSESPDNPVSPSQIQSSGMPSEPLDNQSSSWMMGPASALRILAQNETLRKCTRETIEYSSLKHLFLSGVLVGERDTSPWRIWTPNRTDVVNALEKMVKAVDGELSEDGLMSIGDAVLPHIQHWDRLMTMLRDRTVAVATILPLFGVSILAVLTLIVAAPFYLSYQLYELFQWLKGRYQDSRILIDLRRGEDLDPAPDVSASDSRETEDVPVGYGSAGPSSGLGTSSWGVVEAVGA